MEIGGEMFSIVCHSQKPFPVSSLCDYSSPSGGNEIHQEMSDARGITMAVTVFYIDTVNLDDWLVLASAIA